MIDSCTIIAGRDKTYPFFGIRYLFFLKKCFVKDFCKTLGVLLLLLVVGCFCFFFFFPVGILYHKSHDVVQALWDVLSLIEVVLPELQDGQVGPRVLYVVCSDWNPTGNDHGLLLSLSFLSKETFVWCQGLLVSLERERKRSHLVL